MGTRQQLLYVTTTSISHFFRHGFLYHLCPDLHLFCARFFGRKRLLGSLRPTRGVQRRQSSSQPLAGHSGLQLGYTRFSVLLPSPSSAQGWVTLQTRRVWNEAPWGPSGRLTSSAERVLRPVLAMSVRRRRNTRCLLSLYSIGILKVHCHWSNTKSACLEPAIRL